MRARMRTKELRRASFGRRLREQCNLMDERWTPKLLPNRRALLQEPRNIPFGMSSRHRVSQSRATLHLLLVAAALFELPGAAHTVSWPMGRSFPSAVCSEAKDVRSHGT